MLSRNILLFVEAGVEFRVKNDYILLDVMNNVTLVCNVSQFDYTSADDNNLYLEIDKMDSVDISSDQFIWLRDEEKIC